MTALLNNITFKYLFVYNYDTDRKRNTIREKGNIKPSWFVRKSTGKILWRMEAINKGR